MVIDALHYTGLDTEKRPSTAAHVYSAPVYEMLNKVAISPLRIHESELEVYQICYKMFQNVASGGSVQVYFRLLQKSKGGLLKNFPYELTLKPSCTFSSSVQKSKN